MLISLPPAPVIIRCVKGSRPQQTLNTKPLLVLPHVVGFIWKMRAVYKAPKQRRTPFCLCMDSWRMDQSLWRYHLTEWILGSSVDQKYLCQLRVWTYGNKPGIGSTGVRVTWTHILPNAIGQLWGSARVARPKQWPLVSMLFFFFWSPLIGKFD